MSTIGTVLAIMIGAYWLFLIFKWGWAGFDGVMRFAYSFLPDRATPDADNAYTMSSDEDDDDTAASSERTNRQGITSESAEPDITRHIIKQTQIAAIYKCGEKGITSWELLGCMKHEASHIKACLEGERIARSTLARAMGGTYDEELKYLRSVVPIVEEARPKISIVTMTGMEE